MTEIMYHAASRVVSDLSFLISVLFCVGIMFGTDLGALYCDAGHGWIENCQTENVKTSSLAKRRYVNTVKSGMLYIQFLPIKYMPEK